MYSKGNNYLLAIVVCIIIATSSLVGCDWICHCYIYFENKTSDSILISNVDSSFYFNLKTPFKVAPRGTIFVVEEEFFDDIPSSSDIPDIMKSAFPGGLIITFKEGKTLIYSPDSVESQSFSPYTEKSYRCVYVDGPMIGKHHLHAYYEITDTILNN